jgi:NADPH:quinone reductase-like Zn-dependent oxidoreductase
MPAMTAFECDICDVCLTTLDAWATCVVLPPAAAIALPQVLCFEVVSSLGMAASSTLLRTKGQLS